MSGQYSGIGRQFYDFIQKALHYLVVIPSGKVCTPYASCEQSISAKENPLFAAIIADSPAGMPRSMYNLQTAIAEINDLGEVIPALYPKEAQMLGMK